MRAKTVLTEVGPVQIDVPRDRDASFEPKIVAKRQKRLGGVDEMVISLAAKGLTTGEISAHLAEVYGAEVSRQTISTITDKVVEGMVEWQNRPLDPGRFLVFVANDRCDQSMFPLLHELVWALVLETGAGPVVEFGGDAVEVVAGPYVQVGALGEVLAEQAVGVFVGAALPGSVRVTEVDLQAGRNLNPVVVEHLVALVSGQRAAQPSREPGEGADQDVTDRLGTVCRRGAGAGS